MNKNKSENRILIVDDDEDDFFITSEYIKSIPQIILSLTGHTIT